MPGSEQSQVLEFRLERPNRDRPPAPHVGHGSPSGRGAAQCEAFADAGFCLRHVLRHLAATLHRFCAREEDMNPMARVLSDDLSRLIDRLAASIPQGAFERIRATTPTLVTRLDELETTLGNVRASLIEDYARWTRALDDLENVWVLAAWRSEAEEPVESAVRLAA